MAVTSSPSRVGEGVDPPDGGAAAPSADLARAICPYLSGEDGSWRSAIPTKDQRCGALNPPAPLTLEKQRRLCLGNSHMSCATYLAARGIEIGASPPSAEAVAERVEGGVTRWALVRTVPLLLDQGRVASVARLASQRTGAQLALGGLMALALAAIVLARLPGAGAQPPIVGGAAASPTAVPTFAPVVAPTTVSTPSPTPRQTPPASASPRASASPGPSGSGSVLGASASPAARTYTVQSGDTLYGIAVEFGTTVAAIQDANGMGESTHLNIGQVLAIP